jgi:PTH2 family peptidyl-tRNA hydrolase
MSQGQAYYVKLGRSFIFLEGFMKQVIVVRKDLNMRKGKMVAQGSHASLGAFRGSEVQCPEKVKEWLQTGQTKICVSVDSEAELLEIYTKALDSGIVAYLVRDAGNTELEPGTKTAVCLGPAEEKEIDKITGKLKLL